VLPSPPTDNLHDKAVSAPAGTSLWRLASNGEQLKINADPRYVHQDINLTLQRTSVKLGAAFCTKFPRKSRRLSDACSDQTSANLQGGPTCIFSDASAETLNVNATEGFRVTNPNHQACIGLRYASGVSDRCPGYLWPEV
jgi:hypothetical protein